MRAMMKMRALLLGALVASCALPAAAASLAPVRVIGWARHVGCEVQYTYVVQNNGSSPVRRLLIGLYQPDEGSGAAELGIMPRLDGKSLWIAPWYSRSPSGWNVKASFPEESSKFALEWIEAGYHAILWPGAPMIPLPVGAAPGGTAVLPGATVQDFSVMIRDPDWAYLESRANMDYGDLSLNVQIEKGDTIAPTLDLQVGRIFQRGYGAWATFDVTGSVSDNYDGAPELARPKVIANQRFDPQDVAVSKTWNGWQFSLRNVAGRTYQLQFVATDASGNSTSRTVDYSSVTNGYR